MGSARERSQECGGFDVPMETRRENGRICGRNVEGKREHHNHTMNPFHMNRKNIQYRHHLAREGSVEDFQFAYDCTARGLIPMEKLITHRITLDELPHGLDPVAYPHLTLPTTAQAGVRRDARP